MPVMSAFFMREANATDATSRRASSRHGKIRPGTGPIRPRERKRSFRQIEGAVLLDFLDRGEAEQNLVQAVITQWPVSALEGRPRDFLHAAAIGDHLPDLLGDHDQLVEG